MSKPNLLVLSGSIRSGSVNTRLAEAVIRELENLECEVKRISLEDYPLPFYNGDLEANDGLPENAMKLAKLFDDQDGYFIVSPEYNGSLAPILKNAIDWMSRVKEVDGKPVSPFRGKVAAIGAASPGVTGGMSMLYHKRQILARLGVLMLSEQVMVGNAGKAFDENGNVVEERSAASLKAACASLVEKTGALKKG